MQLEINHRWEAYLRGDKPAFEQIYFEHINMLYDYGMRITEDSGLVEDCIQDLFSDLWEKRRQMNAVHSVRSYLLVAIRRRIIRKLSSARKSTIYAHQELPQQLQSIEPDLLGSLGEEKYHELIQAFAKLSDRQKEVIYLRFYNQLSYDEIAEVMSVQVKAVYKLMARALHALRTEIDSPILKLILLAILAS